jgi:hypothetical protein
MGESLECMVKSPCPCYIQEEATHNSPSSQTMSSLNIQRVLIWLLPWKVHYRSLGVLEWLSQRVMKTHELTGRLML